MQQLTLALTNYQRTDMLFEAFMKVYDDERIKEICIVDDCSDEKVFDEINEVCSHLEKVNLYRNANTLGVYFNKKKAIECSQSEYVIILDSDNIIGTDYLDAIYSKEWYEDTIFAPEKALPIFDYSYFAGNTFTNKTIGHFAYDKGFDCLANTMNYFVNRKRYLEVFEEGIEPIGSDSIHQFYNWLKEGNRVHVLKGLEYSHRVHQGSHYVANARESDPLCRNLIEKLALMK